MGTKKLKHGDFTGLADNYSKFRPSYSSSVRNALLNYVGQPVNSITFADVGAGTGIWTRLVTEAGIHKSFAVEPNDDMRLNGIRDSEHLPIDWIDGSGEQTGLADASVDLLTMASSFHWVDFERGMEEFYRVLKPGGCFAALWNPRYLDNSPLLLEIESKLKEYAPNLKRVSSGLSGITNELSDKLNSLSHFADLMYLEGYHSVKLTPAEYLGVWWSVNDIRVQAGEDAFAAFMEFVENKIAELDFIETQYKTRAWIVRKV